MSDAQEVVSLVPYIIVLAAILTIGLSLQIMKHARATGSMARDMQILNYLVKMLDEDLSSAAPDYVTGYLDAVNSIKACLLENPHE